MKLYMNMPVGDYYGWAICGKNMLTEMSKLIDVKYVPDGYEDIKRSYKTNKLVKNLTEKPNGNSFNFLTTIDNVTPTRYKGEKTVGYMFWEHDEMPEYLVNQLKDFDIIATGSDWNTEIVKKYGFDNVITVHQGVDSELFKPYDRQYMFDKFIIFSGGKFEYRKGQDIVAQAAGYMQKKYKDVYLITVWANIFADEDELEEEFGKIKHLLDPNRTMMISVSKQEDIAKMIGNTDVGIFPNRSEGGTNLVMMEYMSCGKPVIANYFRGQKDVLSKEYALLVEGNDEELLQKCIESLEFAYHNREKMANMGVKAREAMMPFTWKKTAKEFVGLYE